MAILSYNFSSSLCPRITITVIQVNAVVIADFNDQGLHYSGILVIIVVASGLYLILSYCILVFLHQQSAIAIVSISVNIVAVVIAIPLFIIITSAAQ